MACIFMEGFDAPNITDLVANPKYSLSGGYSLVTGYLGNGQALHLDAWGNQAFFTATLPSVTSCYFGVHLQIPGLTSVEFTGGFMSFGPLTFGVNTSNNTLTIGFGTTYGTPGILTGSWQSVWIKMVISATVGAITVMLDGVVVWSVTGVNTGTTPITSVEFNGSGATGSAIEIDDLWLFDTTGSHSNSFPVGDVSIQTLYPTANGTYTDFTPSTGTNYSQVNETISDDATSYNSAGTTGFKDSYDIGSLTGTVSQVHAVQVEAIMEASSSTTKIANLLLISGGTEADGPSVSVTNAAWTPFNYILTDDPNTSAQWTTTAVNACEIGLNIVG